MYSDCMDEARKKPGPRPRGDRRSLSMRVPKLHYEHLREHARQAGIPITSYVVLLLSEHEGLPVPDYVQEELDNAHEDDEEPERSRPLARSA